VSEQATLLLVDDRADNLLALEATLEPLGHRLIRARSGEEALKHLLTEDVAVIVLDVQMPGMDGFATAEQIKQRDRTRDIPIVFLTAINRDQEHRMRGYATGAVDYLFKPIEPDLLRAKVEVFVDLHLKNRLLARKSAELERSNADLEQFAYIASHDLQEPLRVVAGYLELLLDRSGDVLDDTGRDWVERARGATGRMSTLISSLLAYARAGAGAPDLVTVDLDGALANALDSLSDAVRSAGGTVDVAPLGAALGVDVDVCQVLQNLVANALKYRGDDPPLVRVGADHDVDAVTVWVTDNGRGIEDDQLDRVFGMFERLDGEPYPGTGIGLAVARKLVERAGGRIWMERNDGPGVTVRFTLLPATA
jgi:signal transduction histidine kinase